MNILFSDSHIAVANKPSGILSQTDEKETNTMPILLQNQLGGEIFPLHRLDRETGGVMVFARSRKAAAILSQDIQNCKMKKEYLAVLTQAPNEETAVWEDLLFYDRSQNKVFPVKKDRKGVKKARLSYRVLEKRPPLCLVHVFPETGRTHQIRVQFASRKLPLVGDRKYGGGKGTLALFCAALSFFHPITKESLRFSLLPPLEGPWNEFPSLFENPSIFLQI